MEPKAAVDAQRGHPVLGKQVRDVAGDAELRSVGEDGGDVDAERQRLITDYEDTLANPYIAAERGYVDAVIEPATTRVHVVKALRALRTKRETLPPKKHGNIPL